MFLDLDPGIRRKEAVLKELPRVPHTGWKVPTLSELVDLRSATLMSYDVETKDLGLLDHGPGWGRKQGHIVGLSIAAQAPNGEQWCRYLPIRHEVHPHDNLPAANVLAWAKEQLETQIPKTGANLMYDTGWLAEEGVNPGGPLYDIQYAEALLDEQGTTNLEFLGRKYLDTGKSSHGLYDWLARAYGGVAGPKQRKNIYRAPPTLVGFYGESDAALPLNILYRQWALLAEQELLDLYIMECKLTRLLIRMRQDGVSVDVPFAEKLYREMGAELATLERKFTHDYGAPPDINSGAKLGPIFEAQGIKVPRTPAGAYSIQKDWLKGIEDEAPIASDLLKLREFDKLRSTFIRGYILEGHVNGKLHCSFNPLRTDKGGGEAGSQGAKTGRFSSSDPNLQNIPARSDLGKKIREAFIPDHGHKDWLKADYSQIEYRMLAHFAVDDGDGSADALRDHYNRDPLADYHDVVYDRVCPYMGWDPLDKALRKVKRRPIKNTNFGLLYGQGTKKLSRTMNFTPEQARDFFNGYHAGAPYVKPSMEMCAQEVHRYGYVRTILNRRTRFDLWQPFDWGDRGADKVDPVSYERAILMWGSNIKRAYDYRAVNYKFQGSAADMMKRAMVLLDESGVFNFVGYPKLTVHDELDWSRIDDSPAQVDAYRYIQHVMETAIPLRVPVRADPDIGANWGLCG